MLDDKKSCDFMEQTCHEHEELRRLLGNIQQIISLRRDSIDRVAELLTILREQLQSHFNHEQVGGLFKRISKKAPWLTDRANLLEDQHPQFLEDLRELAGWARENRSSPQWWEEIERRYLQFSKEFLCHESDENEMLQEAYGQDIGSQD